MTYSAFGAGADPDHLRLQLPLQPGRRPEGAATTPGTPTRWSGPTPSPPPHYNFEMIPTVYHPALRVQRAGRRRRLPAPDRAAPARGRPARPGHGVSRRTDPQRVRRDRVVGAPQSDWSTTIATETLNPPLPSRPRPPTAAVRTGSPLLAAVFTWPLLFVGGLGDDLPGRHGRARLADDVRHEYVPLRLLGRAVRRCIEHGHRLYGAAVGLATIVLAVWFLAAERRRWLKALGVVALAGGDRPGGAGRATGSGATRPSWRPSTAVSARRSSP